MWACTWRRRTVPVNEPVLLADLGRITGTRFILLTGLRPAVQQVIQHADQQIRAQTGQCVMQAARRVLSNGQGRVHIDRTRIQALATRRWKFRFARPGPSFP